MRRHALSMDTTSMEMFGTPWHRGVTVPQFRATEMRRSEISSSSMTGRAGVWGAIVTVLVAGFVTGLLLGTPKMAQGTESDLPTFGGVELNPDGEIDVARAPDLIAVAGLGDEVAGYARKADLFPEAMVSDVPYDEPAIPLYDQRGEELVGYLVPDHGVVAVDAYLRGQFGPTTPTVTTPGD